MTEPAFLSHDKVREQLERAFGVAQLESRTPGKRFVLVAGDHPVCCQHIRIAKRHEEGRVIVTCVCGHHWTEHSSTEGMNV